MTEHRLEKAKKGRLGGYPPAYRKALVRARTKAERRKEETPLNPGVRLTRDPDSRGSTWGPVFRGDDELWWLMLADALGSVSDSVIRYFIDQLIELADGQRPDETTVNAAIGIIASFQPKTEAEAMLAAQMVAVHMLTMKAAAYAAASGRWHVPERETKLVFRGARAFAEQIEVMARLKGQRSRQDIHVHQHYYDHRQILDGDLHVHQGGGEFEAPTPCTNEPRPVEARASQELAVGGPMRRADPLGQAVPCADDQGETEVPDARLLKRRRGSDR